MLYISQTTQAPFSRVMSQKMLYLIVQPSASFQSAEVHRLQHFSMYIKSGALSKYLTGPWWARTFFQILKEQLCPNMIQHHQQSQRSITKHTDQWT